MSQTEIPEGYNRVTDILSPYKDFSHIDPQVLARKQDIGTRVHAYCESYSLGLFVVDVEEDCKNYVDAYKKWFDYSVVDVVMTETRINSAKYKLSGQFDLLCKLRYDDWLTLVDFKTPDNPDLSWRLQTAAYQILYEDEFVTAANSFDDLVGRRLALMLPRKSENVRPIEYLDHKGDKLKYLNALELYRFFKS